MRRALAALLALFAAPAAAQLQTPTEALRQEAAEYARRRTARSRKGGGRLPATDVTSAV